LLGPQKTEADTGSFDSANGLARESVLSAQDDNVGGIEMKTDADVFRAFVNAGRRLPEIHALRTATRNTRSRKSKRKAKNSTTVSKKYS
jgi:hypothetical protein